MEHDIEAINHGFAVELRSVSAAGQLWLETYTSGPDRTTTDDSVLVEPRYVDDILEGMANDGIIVRGVRGE
jgi:hypothetical protein